MLLAVETETVNNFMLFVFGLTIIFGYFAYRLVYRLTEHITHTREIDQYARHFVENKHLLSGFGENLHGLASVAEQHSYIYLLATSLWKNTPSILSPIFNYMASRSSISNTFSLLNLLVEYISMYFYTTKATTETTKECPKTDSAMGIDLNRLFEGKCNPNDLIQKIMVDLDGIDLDELLNKGKSANTDVKYSANNEKLDKFVLDLKIELNNTSEINQIIDSVVDRLKLYDFTDTNNIHAIYNTVNDLFEEFSTDTNREIIRSSLEHISPYPSNPIKSILWMVYRTLETNKLFSMEKTIENIKKIISKYQELDIKSIDPSVDILLKCLYSIVATRFINGVLNKTSKSVIPNSKQVESGFPEDTINVD